MSKQESKTHQEDTFDVDVNPQRQEIRCRICYLANRPLISLCQCSGSIQYVHQECVIDWITRKMEISQVLEVPTCQICRAQYSAKLEIGTKKLSFDLMYTRIKELKTIQKISSVAFIIGSIVALWIVVNLLVRTLIYLLQAVQWEFSLRTQMFHYVKVFFSDFVFPLIFIHSCLIYIYKRRYIWNDSQVQIVELILNPKVIIKE